MIKLRLTILAIVICFGSTKAQTPSSLTVNAMFQFAHNNKKGIDDGPQTARHYTWNGTDWVISDSVKYTWKNGIVATEITNNKFLRVPLFDPLTKLITTHYLTRNGSGWDSTNKELIWLDSYLNDSHYIYQEYNKTSQIWVNKLRFRKANGYNGLGLFTTSTRYFFIADSSYWLPVEKKDMLYSSGALNQLQVATWDNVSKQFVPEYKLASMTWYNFKSTFENSDPYSYQKLYSSGGGQYVEGERFSYNYDNNDNKIFSQVEDFDVDHYILTSRDSIINTYDANQRLLETITKIYDANNDTYFNVRRSVFSDYPSLTGVKSAYSNNNFVVYPNPASESITLNNTKSVQVLIVSMEGKQMFKTNVMPGESIYINQLENGIYFVQVEDGSKQKLVIMK